MCLIYFSKIVDRSCILLLLISVIWFLGFLLLFLLLFLLVFDIFLRKYVNIYYPICETRFPGFQNDTMSCKSVHIWIYEPGQPFRSQFVLCPDFGLIKQTLNRTSWCNKVDAVRLYVSYKFNLLLPKGQRCVVCMSHGHGHLKAPIAFVLVFKNYRYRFVMYCLKTMKFPCLKNEWKIKLLNSNIKSFLVHSFSSEMETILLWISRSILNLFSFVNPQIN